MRGAWQVMVEAADQFADCADLIFVGDGVEASAVRAWARGKGNVSVQGPVPREQMPGLLLGADVLIVTVRRGAEGYTVPSKTYELFGAGRPIVVIADAETEPARLVREIGCGLVASPDDPREFSDAIRRLAEDRSLCSTMGAAARDASPTFERRVMMQKVVGVVSEVLR